MQCTIHPVSPGVKRLRSISWWLPALFLLCLVAGRAVAADEAELAAAEAPAPASPLPPAVELVAPADAIQWAWIVPATDDDDVGVRLVAERPQDDAAERLGTIRFQYDGEASADTLRIVGTVPEDLDYVQGSATGPGAEASYDAAARQITWTLPGPLDPGTRGLVSFRAVPHEDNESGNAEAR